MRRLFIGLVVAATTVLVPILASAENQEVAEQIAANLRGIQLQNYKIGVKYQDGTAWLKGRVSSREQMATVLREVSETPGVSRVINHLEISSGKVPVVARLTAQPVNSTLTIGRTHDPIARLRTPSGALAPEQSSRLAALGQRAVGTLHSGPATCPAQRLQQVVDTSLPRSKPRAEVSQAQQLASSYVSARVQPTAATLAAEQPRPLAQTAPRRVPQMMPQQATYPVYVQSNRPIPVAYIQGGPQPVQQTIHGGPVPAYAAPMSSGVAPARYDQPHMPNCAWPSYAAYPNYAGVTYPKQYSPTAWPYIGPFYPYPQVPLGWRKVTLEWDDGWWMLDFKD